MELWVRFAKNPKMVALTAYVQPAGDAGGELPLIAIYQASISELYGLAQEIPQRETTAFYPRSPYGAASSSVLNRRMPSVANPLIVVHMSPSNLQEYNQ
jgi:hypothetical protein